MFDDIKLGDEVIISRSRDIDFIAKVTKVTATRFDAGNYTFYKKDGWQYGRYSYSLNRAKIGTMEEKAKINAIHRKTNLVGKLKAFDFNKLSIEQLEAIKTICEESSKR